MNKRNMIIEAAPVCGCSQATVQKCFDAMLDSMKRAVKRGESIQINGFGTFTVVERTGYWGVDPQTKKKRYYPPGKKVRFKGAVGLTHDDDDDKGQNS